VCLFVYLGTTTPVPTRAWREGEPLGVTQLEPAQTQVLARLGTPHGYDLVAWEGCGCGFEHNTWQPLDDDDRERDQRNAASVACLAALLRDVLSREPSAVLYACWADEENFEVSSRRTVPLEWFGRRVFELVERELLTVWP
jgi:hypothetical protein